MGNGSSVNLALQTLLEEGQALDPSDDYETANWEETVIAVASPQYLASVIEDFRSKPTFEEKLKYLKESMLWG